MSAAHAIKWIRQLPWDRVPARDDIRWRFLAILATYVALGVTVLGFNRTPLQIAVTVLACCALDMACHWLFRAQRLLVPLSAVISSMSLTILLNYSHGLIYPLLPVFLTVVSKYLLTHRGRHQFNPTLFAITMTMILSQGMITPSPAYQWGGTIAVAAFIVTAALVVFVARINRTALILAFLGTYFVAAAVRAYITRYHVPPSTIFLGAVSSPAFYLFSFFMITDPATSPRSRRGQIAVGVGIALVDLVLHKRQTLATLFYAGFTVSSVRFLWLHLTDLWQRRTAWRGWWLNALLRTATVAAVAAGLYLGVPRMFAAPAGGPVPLRLVPVAESAAGLSSRPGDILDRVDPRIANVGKWLLSVGDAASVVDFDNDGLQDLFLTLPLKHVDDRAALYRNLGGPGLGFARIEVPALRAIAQDPTGAGIISGAAWADVDEDGDKDLLALVGYGKSRLFLNTLTETGRFGLVDASAAAGLDAYTIAVAANFLDYDRDGLLDILIANVFPPHFAGYDRPTPFNIFKLPDPAWAGDRRMFNVMHRTWHDANNGGGILVRKGLGGGRFAAVDPGTLGLGGTRWTLAIGTGDLDGDGLTDVYLANDFGPDQLLLNEHGRGFAEVKGRLVSELGRDTYKGMNATLGDVDNNGWPDIYVSNVHERLQAEGSLLWMNDGRVRRDGHRAFSDQATRRYALNERRFGWGAAMGDMDRDGRLDIVQANGHLDDNYDHQESPCPDFWYYNANIALTGPDIHGYTDRWADLRGRCIFPAEKNRLYLNRGAHFEDVAEVTGMGEPGASRAVALADFDNDGDLDVVITRMTDHTLLYRNDAHPRAWLGLDLAGNGGRCGRDALGSKVTVTHGGVRQIRETSAVNGLSAQSDRRLLFGFGPPRGGETADTAEVLVSWCGGHGGSTRQTLALGRYHRLTPAAATDMPVALPASDDNERRL